VFRSLIHGRKPIGVGVIRSELRSRSYYSVFKEQALEEVCLLRWGEKQYASQFLAQAKSEVFFFIRRLLSGF
jgi:hypothetical protein